MAVNFGLTQICYFQACVVCSWLLLEYCIDGSRSQKAACSCFYGTCFKAGGLMRQGTLRLNIRVWTLVLCN